MSKFNKTKPEDDAFGYQKLTLEERLQNIIKWAERLNRLSELSEHQVFTIAPLLAVGFDRDPAGIYFNLADLDYEELFKFNLPGPLTAIAGIDPFGSVLQAIVKDYWEDFSKWMEQQAFVNRAKQHYWRVKLEWVDVLDPLSQNKASVVVLPYKLAVFLPNGSTGRYVVESSETPPPVIKLHWKSPLKSIVTEARKEGIVCK